MLREKQVPPEMEAGRISRKRHVANKSDQMEGSRNTEVKKRYKAENEKASLQQEEKEGSRNVENRQSDNAMPGGWEGGAGPLPTAVRLLGRFPGLVPGCMCPGNKPRCWSNPSFRSSQPKVPHWNPNHPYLAHLRWALRESIPSCTPASRVIQHSARALTELNNMLSGPVYEYYRTDKNSGYRTAIKTTMLFTRERETVAARLITGVLSDLITWRAGSSTCIPSSEGFQVQLYP